MHCVVLFRVFVAINCSLVDHALAPRSAISRNMLTCRLFQTFSTSPSVLFFVQPLSRNSVINMSSILTFTFRQIFDQNFSSLLNDINVAALRPANTNFDGVSSGYTVKIRVIKINQSNRLFQTTRSIKRIKERIQRDRQ